MVPQGSKFASSQRSLIWERWACKWMVNSFEPLLLKSYFNIHLHFWHANTYLLQNQNFEPTLSSILLLSIAFFWQLPTHPTVNPLGCSTNNYRSTQPFCHHLGSNLSVHSMLTQCRIVLQYASLKQKVLTWRQSRDYSSSYEGAMTITSFVKSGIMIMS